jgi:p-aminobenzoyl-glutamate transporter AbgT
MDEDEAGLLFGALCLVLAAWLVGAAIAWLLHFWLILLALLIAWWCWWRFIGPWLRRWMREAREAWLRESARREQEARERLRHELARREIEQIYQTTVAAMSEIAAQAQAATRCRSGTAVERRRTDDAERRRPR